MHARPNLSHAYTFALATVVNAKLTGQKSYNDMCVGASAATHRRTMLKLRKSFCSMEHCFGKHGRTAVSFFQFTFAFGGMCAFGVILGDTLPRACSLLKTCSSPGIQADLTRGVTRHLHFRLSHRRRYGLWETDIFKTSRHWCVSGLSASLALI